jgi:hypothetical protein
MLAGVYGANKYAADWLLAQVLPVGDVGATITVSDYKWLSPTLKEAQQQFAVRPTMELFIVDDSIVPHAQMMM